MVYVDDMKAEYQPSHRPGFKYIMSHMVADTDEELHEMAHKIGVQRRWFQKDHYDVTQTSRKLAVQHGAIEITQRQCAIMMMNRRRGSPMGTPEEAQKVLDARLSLLSF